MIGKKKSASTIDLRREHLALYSPKAGKVALVEVPDFRCLMIDGRGHPGKAPDFQDKIGLLYGLAYTLKFMERKKPVDFKVPPLGCIYDADDPAAFLAPGREQEWKWTLLIPLPDAITEADLKSAKEQLREKKNPPYLEEARLRVHRERLSIQTLHVGPYDRVKPAYDLLDRYMESEGFRPSGPCQEVYLSDPRSTAADRLKTIVRFPVKKK